MANGIRSFFRRKNKISRKKCARTQKETMEWNAKHKRNGLLTYFKWKTHYSQHGPARRFIERARERCAERYTRYYPKRFKVKSDTMPIAECKRIKPTACARFCQSVRHSFLLKYEIMSATAAICGRNFFSLSLSLVSLSFYLFFFKMWHNLHLSTEYCECVYTV